MRNFNQTAGCKNSFQTSYTATSNTCLPLFIKQLVPPQTHSIGCAGRRPFIYLYFFHLIAPPNVCYILFLALTIQRNCDGPPAVPQNRSVADTEELAATYERKLIEVSTKASLASNTCPFLL